MTKSATLDLISYTSTAVESAAGKSSCSKDASGFENVFDSVNETYSEKQNDRSENKAEINSSDDKTEEKSPADNYDNKNEKTQTSKADTEENNELNENNENNEINEQNNNSESNKDSADNSDETDTTVEQDTSCEETDTENNNSEIVNENEDGVEYIVKKEQPKDMETQIANNLTKNVHETSSQETELPEAETQNPEIQDIEDASTEEETDIQLETDAEPEVNFEKITEIITNSKQQETDNAETDTTVQDAAEAVLDNVSQKTNTEIIYSKTNENIPNTISDSQTQVVTDKNTKSNLTKILNDLSRAAQVQSRAQAQTQVHAQSQSQVQSQVQANNSNISQQESFQEAQTPVVKTAVENIASDSTLNKSDSTDSTISKMPVNQELFDKTNARIVSVEKLNSESNLGYNYFKNNQNTQDQLAKLAVEDLNDADTPELINKTLPDSNITSETTAQGSFSNTLDSTMQTSIQSQTQVQPNTAPREISQADIMNQINRQINFNNTQSGETTKINIVLNPASLGRINLELVNSQEGLTARMTTDNAQVKEILDKNLDSLKDTLGNQGINVNNVSVKLNETQKQSSENMFSFNDQPNQGGQQSSNNSNSNQKEFSTEENNYSKTVSDESTLETEEANETEMVDISQGAKASINTRIGKVDYQL